MTNAQNLDHCDPRYEVKFYDRNGSVIRSPEKISEISWGRRLDDISRSTLTYIISDETCCDLLGQLEPHAHEMGIYRSGILVWYGWLDDVYYRRGTVEVEAYDALQWGKQRIVRTDQSWIDTDQTDIFVDVWEDGISVDPINAELLTFPSGVTETRDALLGGMPRYVYDVVKEMMDSGLDVTVIGQRILVGLIPTVKPIQISLRDVAGDPAVVKKGSAYAGRIIVDANDVLQSVYPPGPPAANALYPLVEEIVRRGAIESQDAADNIAVARYEYAGRRVPRIVEAGDSLVLQPTLDIQINDLIPGIKIVIDTEGLCYSTKQQFRLGNIDVTVAGGEEKIAVTTQPVGADDLSDVADPL